MKYDIDGHVWWAPEKKLGRGWVPHKDSGSAPTPPDPYQTADAQTRSNQATANYNAGLNRVNTYTPWGSMTYTHTPQHGQTSGVQPPQPPQRTFDQAGYDAAMAQYNNQALPTSEGANSEPSASGPAPNRDDFMRSVPGDAFGGGNFSPDEWSANVTLSPEQQHLLDQQNQMSAQMGNIGVNQLGRVSDMLSHPVDFSGAPQIQNGQLASSVNTNGMPNLQTGADGGQIRKDAPQSGNFSYSAQGGPIQNDLNRDGMAGIQNQIDMSQVPGLIGGDKLAQDLNTQRDSLYGQQAAYLDPQWANRQHDMENQLAQQGVMQNSDAWNRAMDDLGRQRTFDYNQARQSAITGGGAEQSRLFGLGLASNQNAFGQAQARGNFANSAQQQDFGQRANEMQLRNAAQAQGFGQSMSNAQLQNSAEGQRFGQDAASMQLGNAAQQQQYAQQFANAGLNNQASNDLFSRGLAGAQLNNSVSQQAFQQSMGQRQQAINEIMAQRQTPLNELNALRTGSQVTAPNFPNVPGATMQGTDIASQIGQNFNSQMGGYNSQVASNNATTSGLMSLAATAAMVY